MSTALLEAVRGEGARVVLVDITGCTVVDTYTAAHLINTVRSVRLLGAQTIITGISAHVAADLVKLGVRLEDIMTRRRLADGLRLALEFVKQESSGAVQRPEG
jgi:rsbT co-antagonist protein RsbR